MQAFIYFLAGVGAVIIAYLVISLAWTLIGLLLPRKDLLYEYGTGSWAVITGASDGIGLSFSKELAKQGFNVCLIARNPQKLAKVQQQIRELYPDIQTQIIIADFSQSQTPGFYQKIANELRLIDIGVLVNNVGLMVTGKFEQLPVERLIEQINVNCLPPCCMTNIIAPGMLKRQGRSAIINISSTAATVPTPYTSNYSGTKAYGALLSRGIQIQYKNKIDVLCVQPNWVQSNLSNLSNHRFDVVTADECAITSLDRLGYDNVTMGHWKHRLYGWVIRWSPQFLVNRLSIKVALQTHQQRNKAI